MLSAYFNLMLPSFIPFIGVLRCSFWENIIFCGWWEEGRGVCSWGLFSQAMVESNFGKLKNSFWLAVKNLMLYFWNHILEMLNNSF